MILITGGTGTVGRKVIRRLPADLAVRVMSRDPARVTGLPVTAEAVHGDYGDQRSLERALSGVHVVFLVTNPVGDDDARFVRTARSVGVRYVVKLSAAAVADPGADDLITRWQRESEELLRGSGMEWTLLRPRSFMSNTLPWAASIRADGVVRALYGSSARACVDPRDIADVAVRALTQEGSAGRTYTLTGPEAVTPIEQTAQLAELLGHPLRFEELSPEQVRSTLRERYPRDLVEALVESAERQRDGAKARVENTTSGLLGRPAGSYRKWARDHLSVFTSP